MTDVKSRGLPGTRLVNMNSNLEEDRNGCGMTANSPSVVALGEQVEGLSESP